VGRDEIDVDCQDNGGNTALHYCFIRSDNLRGLQLLLAHPGLASLNTKNRDGRTPLMLAVVMGQVQCVAELVRVPGVDLGTTDREGRSLEEMAR
jgi:ankyrin repeat protein